MKQSCFEASPEKTMAAPADKPKDAPKAEPEKK